MKERILPSTLPNEPVLSNDSPDLDVSDFDMDQIACMPLEVSKPFKFEPGVLEELIAYKDKMIDGDIQNTLLWKRYEIVLFSRGKTVEDFTDVSKTTQTYYDRYNVSEFDLDEFNINPMFNDSLKGHVQKLIDYIHEELSIFPAHTALTISTGPVPPHCDIPLEQIANFNNKRYEPSQIKMILNTEEYDDSLFFTKYGTWNSKLNPEIKYFEKEKHMPEGTNSFAWSENFHKHGAVFEEGKTFKVIVNIQGPIDKERHKEHLKRSFAKYKQNAITFEMGTNETFIWNR